MRLLVAAWALLSAAVALAGTTTIECTKAVNAQSGSGQAFNFEDLLELTFSSGGAGHLRLTSRMGTQRLGVLDSGPVQEQRAPTPGFTLFTGPDTHVEGTLHFIFQSAALEKPVGTPFLGRFQSTETDAPAKIVLDLDNMNCKVTAQQ
jgi:hypothetical protein